MRRLVLLAIFASSALHATSFTSASCGWGSTSQTVTNPTSSSCSVPIIIDGNYLGFAGASADVTGALSETGLLGVEGSGGVEFSGSSLPGGGGGSGEATYSQTFATAGPVRPGFVSAVISGFGGYWNASVSEDGYPYGPANNVVAPFELGVRFQVYLTANGGGGWSAGCPSNCDSAGDSSAEIGFFQLTEADGTTPVPYFEVAPAPEPASWKFLLFGLGVTAAFYVRSRKAGSGSLRALSSNLNS